MKPLVEAVVADETGTMKVDVLQPAVAGAQVPPGHAAAAQRQVRGPQPLPRRSATPPTGEAVGAPAEDVATYPATEGCPRRRSSRSCASTRDAARDVARAAAGARCARSSGCPTAPAALDAAHFGDHEGGRRRLAFDELLLLQIALLRRRARRREGARADGARRRPAS